MRPPVRARAWTLARVACAAAVLAACAAPGPASRPEPAAPAPEFYVVRAGDTLYGIARRFGIDHGDVARWNRLGDGSLIYPGQRLRLRPGGAAVLAPAASGSPPPRWLWPTRGAVVAGFGDSARTASGILIAGTPGQPVAASAAGEVVYAGSGLVGYGQLVIIRHDATWLTAYGHNRELLVREGERVAAGQRIASMGAGAGREAVLHFEIRRDGAPVDPAAQLPAGAP